METSAPIASAWPLLLQFGAALLLVAAILGVSYVLGQRHAGHSTALPYEGGVSSLGDARLRLAAKFYLVGLLFVIFDLESVFLFAWAVALYDVGWKGYAEALVFVLVLVAALIYLWRCGALEGGAD